MTQRQFENIAGLIFFLSIFILILVIYLKGK